MSEEQITEVIEKAIAERRKSNRLSDIMVNMVPILLTGALSFIAMVFALDKTTDILKLEIEFLKKDINDVKQEVKLSSADRYTGREHDQFAKGIEARLTRLEKRVLDSNVSD